MNNNEQNYKKICHKPRGPNYGDKNMKIFMNCPFN